MTVYTSYQLYLGIEVIQKISISCMNKTLHVKSAFPPANLIKYSLETSQLKNNSYQSKIKQTNMGMSERNSL